MSKILARFKRAASISSDEQGLSPSSRRNTSASDDSQHYGYGYGSDNEGTSTLGPSVEVTRSPGRTTHAGSHFIEEFGAGKAPTLSPLNTPSHHHHHHSQSGFGTGTSVSGHLTPSPSKRASELPDSTSKPSQSFGTPKLVLTDPDTNSPRSFSSSPGKGTSPAQRPEGLGLGVGLGGQNQEIYGIPGTSSSSLADDLEPTPRANESFSVQQRRHSKSNLSIETTSVNENNLSPTTPATRGAPESTDGSGSVSSRPRSGSIISRLRAGGTSPRLSPTILVDNKVDKSKRKMDKEKRHRRLSASSGKAKSIAAAIVGKTGHNITGLHPSTPDDAQSKRHSLRSPTVTGAEARYSYGDDGDEDEDDDDDDSASELDDDLPVTGFAVASNRRNADFHAMFPAVDEGDYLIEDYGCALSKDILVQGRLYVSENHVCFHANIFGWVTDLVIPFADIRLIEKKMTALVIPNAIGISTGRDKYTFASLLSRDSTFDVMMNIWRLCNPNAVMSSISLGNTSRPASVAGTDAGESPTAETAPVTGGTGGSGAVNAGKGGHAPTQCTCGKEGKHYSETALQATLPSTPEKIYNLMFTGEWIKTFLANDQKLRDLEMSDWKPVSAGTKLYSRSMSYIKPLNGSIGPKQTKCHIVDEQEHFDLDTYISTITTTRTPDVPSGGVFSVKTRTCLMWAGGNATKVVVTSAVEWTGKSWVKGIIEKSATDGQKQYHDDLIKGMRSYIKQHPGEFGSPETADTAGEDKTGDVDGLAGETQTEAEAYAAETRKKRKEEDLGYIQGGLDKVVSGLGTVGSGLVAVFESLGDLLSDMPVSKEVILGGVIILLVVSNVYTYLSFKGRAPQRHARRLERENDLGEVIRLLLEKQGAGVGAIQGGGAKGDPASEVSDLLRLLDDVEKRAASLRSAVAEAGRGGGRAGSLSQVD